MWESKEMKTSLKKDEGEYFKAGVWWKSEKEFIKMVNLEFSKLDKESYDYERQLETKRQFYGIRNCDMKKFI